jgi:hypothetical protein
VQPVQLPPPRIPAPDWEAEAFAREAQLAQDSVTD